MMNTRGATDAMGNTHWLSESCAGCPMLDVECWVLGAYHELVLRKKHGNLFFGRSKTRCAHGI
jgi:hypothetical protein|eukprot:COSAG01_NODE_3756_length_5726_cov_2.015994_6_plen_63_part_00